MLNSCPRRPHVVIAGQMPPPIGGQNINIKRVHDLLAGEEDLCVSHLKFEFTKEWAAGRRFGIHKLLELVRVMVRVLRIRKKAPIDFLLYPAGGPHTVPIIRDWILLPFLALFSRRVVVHFRAAGLNERLKKSSEWFRFLTRAVYKNCASDAVVLAEYGKRDAESVGIERISVLPNAYEDQAMGVYAREEGDLESSSILSVGHLCADKGVPQLIEAFGRITGEYRDVRLILVGEVLAPYTERQLKADIEASGAAKRIEWKGILTGDDLARVYKDADLFTFASVAPYESFGMVLIEAMQWSLPVVVTDWRANVSVCGEGFGGVVAREPEKALSSSIERALREALQQREFWSEWGELNRQIYTDRYTLEQLRYNLRMLIGVSGA